MSQMQKIVAYMREHGSGGADATAGRKPSSPANRSNTDIHDLADVCAVIE